MKQGKHSVPFGFLFGLLVVGVLLGLPTSGNAAGIFPDRLMFPAQAELMLDPGGKENPPRTSVGAVSWSIENSPSTLSNASVISLRAVIQIPDEGLTATLIFRRNLDLKSPNSHLIEVSFSVSDKSPLGAVRDLRMPEMRSEKMSRGTQLSGIPVPVTKNVFLIGLNSTDSEKTKNLKLLQTLEWFAMPIRIANGRNGTILFAKGNADFSLIDSMAPKTP